MVEFMDSMDPADTVQLVRNRNGSQSVTEMWRVFNTTADVHPIHLHSVAFQVVARQKFAATITDEDTQAFDFGLYGRVTKPNPEEARAWKDTVQMAPGEVTTIIVKFDLPGNYVWHCHILEHEEHDMMHWLVVLPATANTAAASTGLVSVSSGTTPTAAAFTALVGASSGATPTVAGAATQVTTAAAAPPLLARQSSTVSAPGLTNPIRRCEPLGGSLVDTIFANLSDCTDGLFQG
jgi:hypothetical protein